MRYLLLIWSVAACSVDHTGLAPAVRTDAALPDAALPDAALPDAALPDASPDACDDDSCDECLPGFVRDGDGCRNTDDCDPNPCMNGGSCVDGVDTFTCTCRPPFTGAMCENEESACAPNPCMNGGTCTEDLGGFVCVCAAGFSGAVCETEDLCAPNPCMNDGICSVRSETFGCRCPVEFDGPTCESAVPEVELAFYDPVGESRPDVNPLPVTDFDARISASPFENETYGESSGTNPNDRRPVLMSAGALNRATTFYVTVTLTPAPAEAIALSRITYSYRSYSSGATGGISARTSADDFTTTVDSVPWRGATGEDVTFDMSSVPRSAGPLEVRLYMHDLVLTAPDRTRDWADLMSTATSSGDGMRVFGRVVPE